MLSVDIQLQQGSFILNANFSLENSVTGLFGPSGSGKSTLLSLIAGLKQPDNGWVRLNGKYLYCRSKNIKLPANKRKVGVVFQDNQLFPHLTVMQNLVYGYNRTDKNLHRFEVAEIIGLLEISHLLGKRPSQLSGGEKQRIALGRALLASPQLLLLDEPLASLDTGLKQQILPFLKTVKDELKLPMVYVSHSIEEILHLTDHLVVISEGKTLGCGQFYDVIKAKNVQDIIGSMGLENTIRANIIKNDTKLGYSIAEIQGHTLFLPLADKLSKGDSCYLSIRSNEIAIAKHHIAHISIQNQIKGTIISYTKKTSGVSLNIDIGTTLIVDISPKAFSELGLNQGSEVYCLIKAQSFSFLGKAE